MEYSVSNKPLIYFNGMPTRLVWFYVEMWGKSISLYVYIYLFCEVAF